MRENPLLLFPPHPSSSSHVPSTWITRRRGRVARSSVTPQRVLSHTVAGMPPQIALRSEVGGVPEHQPDTLKQEAVRHAMYSFPYLLDMGHQKEEGKCEAKLSANWRARIASINHWMRTEAMTEKGRRRFWLKSRSMDIWCTAQENRVLPSPCPRIVEERTVEQVARVPAPQRETSKW